MTPDFPVCRQAARCALCLRAKDTGLVVCWDCYRRHHFRVGIPPAVELKLKRFELGLLSICAGCGCTEDDPCPDGCSWVAFLNDGFCLCSLCAEQAAYLYALATGRAGEQP